MGIPPSITYTAISARMRHLIKDPSIQHERAAKNYSEYTENVR